MVLSLLVALSVWVCRDAWFDIWGQATADVEQGQILLVPFVIGFMVWVRRRRLGHIRYQPSVFGVVMLVAALLLRAWGLERDILIAWHFAAILVMVACLVCMVGVECFRQFGSAFVASLFLLPVPGVVRQAMALPLQHMAASVTSFILDIAGFEVVQQGSILVLNGVEVAVGEACNGMRMILALALVVFAFVFSVPFRLGTRVLLILISPVIALVCNVLRLVPTALVYGYGSSESAERFHDIAGWFMLPAALAMLLGFIKVLKWLELPVMNWRLTK